MQINLPILPEQGQRTRLYILASVLIISAALFAYKVFFCSAPTHTSGYTAAAPAHGMAGVPVHDVVVQAPVKALDKKQAARKMDLPADIADDPDQEVISTSSLKPSEGGYTTATVLNTATGESTTIVREEPRPWFSFGGKTEIGARAGLVTSGGQQGTLYARQDIARAGSMTLAGYGEASASTLKGPEAKAMVDISYRW